MSQGLQDILVPTFKGFRDLSGGLNVLQPPDAINDNQSPDMQNLIYINGVLQTDTGYVKYGNPVCGTPLQPLQFELTTGSLITCLITTTCFYVWSSGISDWILAMTSLGATTTSAVPASDPWSTSFSSDFGPSAPSVTVIPVVSTSGAAVGEVISVACTNGTFFVSTIASISGTNITTATSPQIGQAIASGAAVNFYAALHGGPYPISYTVDPTTNTLIWTNGVDPVQAYSGSGGTAPLAGLSSIASTARLVARFYGFTLAIGTVESGTAYPYRVRRSTNVSSTDWTSAIAGFDNLIDTADEIISASIIGPYLVLGRENSIMTATYWGTTAAVFFYQYTLTGMGVLAGASLTKTPTNDVVVSPSGVYYYQAGYQVQSIGDLIYNYFLGPNGNLSPANGGNLFTLYVAELDEVWLFYPSVNATECDTLLRYSNKYNSWFPQKLPIQISGAGFALNTNALEWAQDTQTWAQKTQAWNSRAATGNYPIILLASALDQQVYAYDFKSQTQNGAQSSWHFTTKDFPVLNEKLLFDGIVAYGKGNGVLVEISTNQGQSYQTIGTFNFGTTFYTKQTLDYQVTGDFFRIRMSGVGYGFFLSQFDFRYLSASEY